MSNQTTSQTIEWHLSVDAATKGGHPIQRIEMNFGAAAASFDQLVESYPKNTVRMFSIVKQEIKRQRPSKFTDQQ